MPILAFPSQFPLLSVQTILQRLRGEPVPLAELAEALWQVTGFALGQALGGNVVQANGEECPCDCLTDEQLCKCLECCCHHHTDPTSTVHAASIPWLQIALTLAELLSRYLKK